MERLDRRFEVLDWFPPPPNRQVQFLMTDIADPEHVTIVPSTGIPFARQVAATPTPVPTVIAQSRRSPMPQSLIEERPARLNPNAHPAASLNCPNKGIAEIAHSTPPKMVLTTQALPSILQGGGGGGGGTRRGTYRNSMPSRLFYPNAWIAFHKVSIRRHRH